MVDSRRQFINLEARFIEGFAARIITIDLVVLYIFGWKKSGEIIHFFVTLCEWQL